MSPLCESYVAASDLDKMEPYYPLRLWVCRQCLLVQLAAYVRPEEIFAEYAYFSSYSDAWLEHAESYVAMITERLQLGPESHVIELASNDGYLLQHFVRRGIPCLGVEPARNVAETALARGVPTQIAFFQRETADGLRETGPLADLVIANNVLAHVPDLNGFVAAIPTILAAHGTVTLEFPHLMQLFANNEFDTIYHEHFCYFSLLAVETVFARHGLTIFDVEELWTHGGSLRIYARHAADATRPTTARLDDLRHRELAAGFRELATYAAFQDKARATKNELLEVLIEAKSGGKRIAAYGAPGKSTTLLNYCGVGTDFLDFTVDKNPFKQGKYLPGTHIPIFAPDELERRKPDYIVILPWNLKDEIIAQLQHVRGWGARFIVPIPHPTIL